MGRCALSTYAGIYLAGHRDSVVTGNLCIDDQRRHTQLRGLDERTPAGTNIVKDNHCAPSTA